MGGLRGFHVFYGTGPPKAGEDSGGGLILVWNTNSDLGINFVLGSSFYKGIVLLAHILMALFAVKVHFIVGATG